ncbi:hypothetical protein [Pseudoxanthomonas sp.]|uniref:hypothetical protein n=1 Tax=Pseudoxanthomonas sp. TaxID=1871049 RepID=UPI002619D27D|nr:hypothetical protein [Pseudoxanthomonas sp.]WDS35020.1 MAG: hypothetical protein O8I58_11615 [Pseudoxanthomonas sp.]
MLASLRLLASCALKLEKKAVFIPAACLCIPWATQQQVRLPSERIMARVGARLAGHDHPVSRVEWRWCAQAKAMPAP